MTTKHIVTGFARTYSQRAAEVGGGAVHVIDEQRDAALRGEELLFT